MKSKIGQNIYDGKRKQIDEKYKIFSEIINDEVTLDTRQNKYYDKLMMKREECVIDLNKMNNRYEPYSLIFNAYFQEKLFRLPKSNIYDYYSNKYSINDHIIKRLECQGVLNKLLDHIIMNKNLYTEIIELMCYSIYIMILFCMIHFSVGLVLSSFFFSLLFISISLYTIKKVFWHNDEIDELFTLICVLFFTSIVSIILILITYFINSSVVFLILCLLCIVIDLKRISILLNQKVSTINGYFIKNVNPDKYSFYTNIFINDEEYQI